MQLSALDGEGVVLRCRTYYSVGGGVVVDEAAAGADRITTDQTVLPYPYRTGVELLEQCRRLGGSIKLLLPGR